MKRFRFALRPLAVVRAHAESRALEAFAVAVRGCLTAEGELAAAQRRAADFEGAVVDSRRTRYRATAAASSLSGYRRQCAAVAAAEKALSKAREEVQQRRSEYLEAHRRREVVQRLEDKAKQAYGAAAAREEQAMFDELSSGRRARSADTIASASTVPS